MKRTFISALLAAALSAGMAAGCGDDSPQAFDPQGGDDPSGEVSPGNETLDPSYSYLLTNKGPSVIRLGYNASSQVSVKFAYANSGGGVPDVKVRMQLSMSGEKTASFSNSSVKTSVVINTDSSGVATANVYSAKTDATGFITVSVTGPDGAELDVNKLSITVNISGGSDPTGGDGEDGGGGGTVVDDDPEEPGKGILSVKVENRSTARNAEVYYAAIESGDGRDYCADFLAGNGMNPSLSIADMKSVSVSGGTGAAIFRSVPADKKAVTWAYGLDSYNAEMGSIACAITEPIAAEKTVNATLVLDPPPVTLPDMDQSYDVQMHLDLSKLMPASWQKWFDLIDGLFTSPVGTAVYYAVYAWEHRSGYENGGGSNINLVITSLNVWDAMIEGDLGHEPTLPELLRNCDISTAGAKTGDCPEYKIKVAIFSAGPWNLFPLAVNAAEDAIEGWIGDLYGDIKKVGNDIVTQARKFDIGARFAISQTGESTVQVKEDWTHVVWTWRLNDDSEDCQNNEATCGRHAFQLARKADLSDSFVNLTYAADIGDADETAVQLKLPSEHSFILQYGKLIRILINNVVAVQVMLHDEDGLDSDGDLVVVDPSTTDFGDLLNYWIPCYRISDAVYNWLVDKISNWQGAGNVGTIIAGLISAQQINGYCEQGLGAASDYALEQLDKLMVDANVKVRAGSTFWVTDIRDDVPKTLKNMNYKIGVTVTKNGVDEDNNPVVNSVTDYDAVITGEGILAKGTPADLVQCADFLTLNDSAAMAACGN